MQSIEGAVIACAGLGSRLGMGLPKCMVEVGGQTILSRLIDSLEKAVSRIHVVVGYREEMIAEYCARHHRNVVLVRNPDFRTTNTAYSYMVGATGFSDKTVFLDGDLLIEEASLNQFVKTAATEDVLVGVTPASTEKAVYVDVQEDPDSGRLHVRRFDREVKMDHEWANIACAPANFFNDTENGYVFERLSRFLPLAAGHVNLHEIDTPADMEKAEAFLNSLV